MNFFEWNGDILVLRILGTAGAKREGWGKVVGEEIKLAVKVAPEHGKATAYMQKWLAGAFEVPQKNVEVAMGATSPHKIFRILKPKSIPKVLQEYGVMLGK